MVVGPALVHFALSQVLGLNLRFEIHDSDMSRLSLKMDGAALVAYLLVWRTFLWRTDNFDTGMGN